MATSKAETGSMSAIQFQDSLTPKAADGPTQSAELPSMVQCGTIEELLHRVSPPQTYARASLCWEEAWQQVLQAMDSPSLPGTVGGEKVPTKEANGPIMSLEPASASEEIFAGMDTSLAEVIPTSPLPLKNMWLLQLHLEDDIEGNLEALESMAHAYHWPNEEWVAQLKTRLSSNTLPACSASGCNSLQEYSLVKERILQQYGITTEMQRQRFRQFRYHEATGPREAHRKLQALGQRWLKPEKHTKEQILDLLILEQFLTILPQEMQSWVRECSPETCAQAIDLAESFQLGSQPPVPFQDICVKFTSAEWALLSEDQRALYRDVMLENFQNVSTLGIPVQKPGLIFQIQERGEPCFQDNSTDPIIGDSEDRFIGNALLPAFQELVTEKEAVPIKEQATAAGATQCYSGPTEDTSESPSPVKQPSKALKQRAAKMAPARTPLTKRQAPAPKRKTAKRKKQQPEMAGEPSSRKKGPPSPLQGETSGRQESDAMISTTKPCKQRRRPGDGPPKLKKQPVPLGESSKLRNKPEAPGKPPRLKKELPLPGEALLQQESQQQQEKQQLPPLKSKLHEAVTPIMTWHPPFSATILSDLTCPDCGRTFKQRCDLRHHRYVHTNEKPYACQLCEKRFRHPSNLHIHLRTHSGERPYQCLECGKAFSQSCNLRTHSQIHSGSKPFCCFVCGKSFRHSSNLTIHQRIHTGERPYPCSICPKRFGDRSTLVQHERTHTGERPYACRVCEQRFSQISHLIKHSRVHPGARGPPPPPPPLPPKPSEVFSLSPQRSFLMQSMQKIV